MKRITLLLLAAVLVITSVSGASLAYFTDSEISNNNTITSGNIQIVQYEQERTTDAQGNKVLQPFTPNQAMMPLVQSGNGTEDWNVNGYTVSLRDASAANYIDKLVTVKNIGVNPAYIRTVIAVPTADSVDWLHIDTFSGQATWTQVENVSIEGVTYDLYVATYNAMLEAGASSAPSLLGFWADSLVDFDGKEYYIVADGKKVMLGALSDFRILVATQAVQTTTFEQAQDALDTVFGTVTAANNPWSNSDTMYVSSDAEFAEALSSATSGQTIRLANGSYTLPAVLPAAIRIVGQSSNVVVSASAPLQAAAIELHNLTVQGAFSFTGSGEFDQVTFEGGFTALFDNPAYIVDCAFSSAPRWSISAAAVRDTVIFENCTGPDPIFN